MQSKLFDIGANLTHESFSSDLSTIINESISNNIEKISVTGCNVEDSLKALSIAEMYPNNLISTCGIHPHYADSFNDSSEIEIKEIASNSLVKAIGETGLDFNRNYSKKENQINSFIEHIKIANELNLPMFLHQRDSHKEFMTCLKDIYPETNCVVHCFTGSEEELDAYLSLDFYIGITGWICDEKRGSHLKEFISKIPLDKLLIETDSPYLLPKNIKIKGRRNKPLFLKEVFSKISSIRNEPVNDLSKAIYQNSLKFFNLEK
jgi:TatD DNase family protein|tara:strand:+ start:6546 stop:7334 length:789 start_codon:yes stop_codon:yes gene_type:complete